MQMGPGEQAPLDAGREPEIALERPGLGRRQMRQAQPDQGVADQPVRLDGLMADLAQSVSTGVHAGEGRVDLVNERRDLGVGPAGPDRPFELAPAVDELLSEDDIHA